MRSNTAYLFSGILPAMFHHRFATFQLLFMAIALPLLTAAADGIQLRMLRTRSDCGQKQLPAYPVATPQNRQGGNRDGKCPCGCWCSQLQVVSYIPASLSKSSAVEKASPQPTQDIPHVNASANCGRLAADSPSPSSATCHTNILLCRFLL